MPSSNRRSTRRGKAARHGGQIDADHLRKFALRRQPVARIQLAVRNGALDEIDDLQIARLAVVCEVSDPVRPPRRALS